MVWHRELLDLGEAEIDRLRREGILAIHGSRGREQNHARIFARMLGYLQKKRPGFVLLWILLLSALWQLMLPAVNANAASEQSDVSKAASRQRIKRAWDKVYEMQVGQPVSPQTSPSGPSLPEYVTFSLGGAYTFNSVDFSGEPTVSFIVDDGPDFTVTPEGISFPQVFESTGHTFASYASLGTRGYGHDRVNTYVSAVLRHDLDGTTAGSPFQTILDDHGGETLDLSNAFVEMNGLGITGVPSHMDVRLGRQFIPAYRVGFLGSPVIDGARFDYDDSRIEMALFAGRWVAFYKSVSGVFVGGGRIARQLFPNPQSDVGLAPYVEYLYVNDTEGSMATNRHTYGLRGRWKALEADGYVSIIDADPIELGLRTSYIAGNWTVYGRLRKRLSSDDFTFDVFLTVDDLSRRRRLLLDTQSPATEFTLDTDYQLLSWLSLGAGVWVYALDDKDDQTGFDANFVEANGRLHIALRGPWSGTLQYRYRHVDRGSNAGVTLFDDTSRSGETAYHEFSSELGYSWRDWFSVQVGGYYAIYDTQNRLLEVDGIVIAGGYVRSKARVARAVSVHLLFGVDQGNEEFNPDIDVQYMVRAGVDINY